MKHFLGILGVAHAVHPDVRVRVHVRGFKICDVRVHRSLVYTTLVVFTLNQAN